MADSAQKQDMESAEESLNEGASSDETLVSKDVQLNKSIVIHSEEPLHILDKGIIKAYRATGSNKLASELFALMCDKSMTPRRMASVKYSKIANAGLVGFVGSGKVYWPPANEEKFFMVFEKTLGQPILKGPMDPPAVGWRSEDVMTNVAHPMISILSTMRDKDIVHGQIWPGNMFYGGKAGAEKIVLGECLSSPASSMLPALYEPIERALADPEARGVGSFADDIYSFGVSLAVILRGADPTQGMSDEKIIERKIEKGSYTTLLGKERLSGAMLELMRGLLYDEPEQRWTIEDLVAWMDGRRLTPKQSPKRPKATRPIMMANKKYIRPELLAKDARHNIDEMARLVESEELAQWIDRAIEDKLIKVRMEQVMKDVSSYDRTDGYNARLSVVVSTALYTECPVFYKSLAFIPAGFGKAMSRAYALKKDMQDYVDVLRYSFVMPSIRMRKNTGATSQLSRFDSARTFISQSAINSGLERCIYFMDPECPCLSPIFDKYYVQTPEELLTAFDDICSKEKPSILFDRHVISFLSVKDRRNVDPYLGDLTSSEAYKRTLGRVRTLATIQKRARLGKFPHLSAWVTENLEDVYERFHDSKKRESIKKHVDKLKKEGDLQKIALCFDDPYLFQEDVGGFYQAMQEYKRLESKQKAIEDQLKNKKNYGERSGQQVASVVSMVLAFFIMIISAYFILMKG